MNQAEVRIIAVPDPDQSIYGFTGAKPSLHRDLYHLPVIERIPLQLNYLCATRIIDASKALLPNPPDSESHDGREGLITIHKVGGDVDAQALYALNTLVPQMLNENPKWKLGDIAFLYRTFREGSSIARSADEFEIRYFRLDSGALIKRTRLIECLTDAAIWCSGAWKTGVVTLGQILKSWRLLRPGLKSELTALEARVPLNATLFENRDGSMTVQEWIGEALHSSVERCIRFRAAARGCTLETLKNLYTLTKKNKPLERFTVEVFANLWRSPNQLNLRTLPSSTPFGIPRSYYARSRAWRFPV